MNYPQYRRMRKLVHECCNYDGGNCILLDDGEELKRCVVCGQPFLPGSNRVKYCKFCAKKVHRKQKTASDRKRRLLCGQLEAKKP